MPIGLDGEWVSRACFHKVDDHFVCDTCGAMILEVRRVHPVWDGPFPCSGEGRTESESVPYCPTCDEVPK